MESIRRGDRGEAVRDVQARLTVLGHRIDHLELEGDRFEDSTLAAVRSFQDERGLMVDGVVGPDTWQELVEAGYSLGDRVLYLRRPPFRGDDVRILQRRLNTLGFDPGREDAILGEQTDTAIRDFQRNVGLAADGVVAATTLAALERLRLSVPGPGRTLVREGESLRTTGSLEGRVIALEAAHGPGRAGGAGPAGLREGEVTFALAEHLAQVLGERGAKPLLLRGPGEDPPLEERIRRANDSGADALVSFHLAIGDDPQAAGATAYYFGRLGTESPSGRALAGHLLPRVAERLGVPDSGAHPKAFPMLRETRMPAVVLLPCHITNPREERLVADARFVHDVAVALIEGLEEHFAGGEPPP